MCDDWSFVPLLPPEQQDSDGLVERVAETLWQAESERAAGRQRLIPWSEANPKEQDAWRLSARAAIAAMRPNIQAMSRQLVERTEALKTVVAEFETDFCIEGVIVDDPPKSFAIAYRTARKALEGSADIDADTN